MTKEEFDLYAQKWLKQDEEPEPEDEEMVEYESQLGFPIRVVSFLMLMAITFGLFFATTSAILALIRGY